MRGSLWQSPPQRGRLGQSLQPGLPHAVPGHRGTWALGLHVGAGMRLQRESEECTRIKKAKQNQNKAQKSHKKAHQEQTGSGKAGQMLSCWLAEHRVQASRG